ncbi:hypothetical protein GEMRC1_005481 [Eukaryota sp. GEM-RC1]
MRLRLGLFRSELLDENRPKADFKHIASCKKFLQFRSILPNAVRDVTYEMFKCHGFSEKIEPLLKHCSDDNITNSRHGGLFISYLDSCQAVIDCIIFDPCAKVCVNSVSSDSENHLPKAEKRKISTYSASDKKNKLNSNFYSFSSSFLLLYQILVTLEVLLKISLMPFQHCVVIKGNSLS